MERTPSLLKLTSPEDVLSSKSVSKSIEKKSKPISNTSPLPLQTSEQKELTDKNSVTSGDAASPATSLTPRSQGGATTVASSISATGSGLKRQTSLATSFDQQSPSPRPMRMARDPAKQAAFVNRFANLGTKPSRLTNSLLSLSAQSQTSQAAVSADEE